MSGGWTAVCWLTMIGLPVGVIFASILWPQRAPKERTVEAIRRRIEDEDRAHRRR